MGVVAEGPVAEDAVGASLQLIGIRETFAAGGATAANDHPCSSPRGDVTAASA